MPHKSIKVKLFLILSSISLSSCISGKRFVEIVNQKSDYKVDSIVNADWLTVNLEKKEVLDINKFDVKKNAFLPLLIYNQWNKTLSCELSPRTSKNILESFILDEAYGYYLPEKLNDKTVEINLKDFNESFIYSYKGYFLFLLIAYVQGHDEVIIPEAKNFKAIIKIKNDDGILWEKEIYYNGTSDPIRNRYSGSKKFILSHLKDVKEDQRNLSRTIIKEILNSPVLKN